MFDRSIRFRVRATSNARKAKSSRRRLGSEIREWRGDESESLKKITGFMETRLDLSKPVRSRTEAVSRVVCEEYLSPRRWRTRRTNRSSPPPPVERDARAFDSLDRRPSCVCCAFADAGAAEPTHAASLQGSPRVSRHVSCVKSHTPCVRYGI